MKTLKYTIQESLRIGICDEVKISACESLRIGINDNPYTASPTTWNELRKIIFDRYEKQGPGTKDKPIDFNDIDVSGMTSFCNEHTTNGIFERTEFEYIDISEWDVSHIKNMNSMFIVCHYLISIGDLSNWNVSNVKDVGWMFGSCTNLESIGDLSKWDISGVEDIHGMFYCCKNLESIGDISRWDISSVKNMDRMFTHSGIINIPKWYKI